MTDFHSAGSPNAVFSFYRDKSVFITGHTGFKGTWLCNALLQAGARVTGFALEAPTTPSLFELSETEKRMKSIQGDVRDLVSVQKALTESGAQIVFHMAAQPLVRLSYSEPVSTFETNVLGTVNLLEAVRHTPSVKSVINITTDKVYENREWHWGYRENENLCGFDPYSNSKSCSELVTYSYQKSFFNTPQSPAISTARSGNVIGGGDYALDRIIPDCVRAAENKQAIIIRNPHSTRPYQHVLECLSGYLLLAQKQYENKSLSGSYNFGPDDESCVSTGQLVELFCKKWGDGLTWKVQGDGGPHEASFLKLDCTKAKTVLGWHPRWDIGTAIEKTAEFSRCLSDEEKTVCMIEQICSYFAD